WPHRPDPILDLHLHQLVAHASVHRGLGAAVPGTGVGGDNASTSSSVSRSRSAIGGTRSSSLTPESKLSPLPSDNARTPRRAWGRRWAGAWPAPEEAERRQGRLVRTRP